MGAASLWGLEDIAQQKDPITIKVSFSVLWMFLLCWSDSVGVEDNGLWATVDLKLSISSLSSAGTEEHSLDNNHTVRDRAGCVDFYATPTPEAGVKQSSEFQARPPLQQQQ